MRRVLKLAAAGAAATLVLAACGEAPTDDTEAPANGEEAPADDAEGDTEGDAAGDDAADDTEGGAAGDDAAGTADDAAGDEEDATGEDQAAVDGGDFLACMVSDSGGFDDQSFNQSGKEGMDSAEEELGITTQEVESQSDADYTTNVGNLVNQGCNLTIGVGFLLEDAIQEAAEANPDTNFALIDSAFSDENFEPVEVDNARPILFNTAEASFLAGYLAAGMTESGTVATFGGMQIPSVAIFMDGFADGVDKYNEDNGSDITLLGWDKESQNGTFSGDFENQSQGQTLTEQFIAQGADIIMPVAGPVGLGAAAAADSAGDVRIIWVDSDGYLTAEGYDHLMLTSVVKEIGAAVHDTIQETIEGGFTNEPYVGTLENEGVGLAEFHDMQGDVDGQTAVGPDGEEAPLADIIDAYKEQIISGELVVETPNAPVQ